ncbi:flocculation protein FLO11 isoform X1 [Lucilia cuprina]|uniref:flocculation protein FLO11 isoform X1 n=1 Tax=Lucilia cuprina TaxID=7375 RepID=UPI001F059BEA|nr:flocculation protein FLO11 isoform X1 [Lucilia cuprina]
MISRHRKCRFITLTLLVSLFCLTPHTALSLAPAPVDYLVPPPLPQANAATHVKQARTQNILPAESRTIPKFINPQLPVKPNDKHPGLMTRVARWFGFANQNTAATDQQLAAGTNKQQFYYYQKPQQQQQYGSGDKEPCSLCNKYPWVPMMANSIHYPITGNQWDAAKQSQQQQHHGNYNPPQNLYNGQQPQNLQNTYGAIAGQNPSYIQHAASSVKQRAVKFNFPLPYVPQNNNKVPDSPNNIQYSSGPFLPIPIPPLLSNSALPPLYVAQNFLPEVTPAPNTIQQLPSTEPAHFAENIAEHSEIHIDTAIPTQIPPTIPNKDASFEIVKSHQLVDYISSVEYPANYVPSHAYDVSTQATPLPLNNQQTDKKINTGLYQHSTFSPNLDQHVPASQILTDPSSFIQGQQQQSNQQSEQTTFINQQPQYLEQVQHYEYDNFVAASHQNSSVVHQQQQQHEQQQQHNTHLDAWTLESNDYIFSTSSPEAFSTTEETSTFTSEWESTTEQQTQDNEVEFIASVQTNAQQSTKLWPQKPKQRETPKRLLDSPIQHNNGNLGAPRPFTRDPSDLTFRLGPTNHKLPESSKTTTFQQYWKPQTPVTEAPISTSTFSSIDASGQYAGMAPPSLPSTYNSDQILLPHLTTKNRPRPFETTKVNMVTKTPSTAAYSTWSQAQNIELHTPQESMLVNSHVKPAFTTTTTTVKPRTTKYLTKILASNLRELLQREHEPTNTKLKVGPNALDIDINKLQKNIDDWTEQEYTSLSHKPSTPTIRGRSKHIPSEYLPTTMAAVKAGRQSKTTKGFTDNSELPSSINNLEPLYERESTKRFQYTQITDNHLRDFYNNFESLKSRTTPAATTSTTMAPPTTTTTVATTTTSTTSTTTTEKPFYLRPIQMLEPEELWKKAKVSISPKTQEKVYVVTPQPRFFPQRFYSPTVAPTTTTTTTERSFISLGSGFKSPRFLVRPTPGNAHKLSKISDTQSKENSKENLSNSYFTPEWFGLKGLSAYVPSQPVEIIDGNSKVLNIVTPPSNLETTTRHSIMDLTKDRHASANKRKSTMAPSPR